MGNLNGKTAVVLGASGKASFGSSVARRLAAEGADVVVSARRVEPLEALAAEIGGVAVACDVTEEAQIEALFAAARDRYGRVDMAVYSAGFQVFCAIADLDAAQIQPTLDISFTGALLFFKHAAAAMTEGGSVVTMSSLTARIPGPGLSVYAGARAGIDYAIRVAAMEYAQSKVRFNSVAAGLIKTDMTAALFEMEPVIQAHMAQTPAGRMGTLDDVAEAVLFLLDDNRAGYINGQVLDLAGGQHMGALPRFEELLSPGQG
jgi:NAD(P)-dependent dehydrogenase (short-subunit alcohol dehydrogenase family)